MLEGNKLQTRLWKHKHLLQPWQQENHMIESNKLEQATSKYKFLTYILI
jgi:hypothetical protein